MTFLDIVIWPFAWILRNLYYLFDNYGFALIAFTVVIKLVLTPFQMKSKKSMMKTSRLTPKVKALEAKYADDKQKYQMEVQKLYKEEGISPMSGCLWTLIPLAIMLLLYQIIRYPLENLFLMSNDTYNALYEFLTTEATPLFSYSGKSYYEQLNLASNLGIYWDQIVVSVPDVLSVLSEPINFTFLGINLGDVPTFLFWNSEDWGTDNWNAFGLWLIPIFAGLSQLTAGVVSQKMNQSVSTDNKGEKVEGAMANMKTMIYMMPIVSVWFAFIMPAGIGIYWISNAIFGMIQDTILSKHIRKVYDREDEIKRQKAAIEEEKEAARQAERERREAEGIKEVNPNTSKKKIAAQKKASVKKVHHKPIEKMTARELAEYWAKVAEEEEKRSAASGGKTDNASQVGSRPYARGRNYNPNRYGVSNAPTNIEAPSAANDTPLPSDPSPELEEPTDDEEYYEEEFEDEDE